MDNFNWTAQNAWIPIVTRDYNAARNYSIFLRNDGALHFAMYNSLGQQTAITSGNGAIVAGRWYHIVGTYDGTAMRLYLNGALISTAGIQSSYVTTPSIQFGTAWYQSTGYNGNWTGYLGDTAVYNRALTPQQIYTHWISSTYGAKFAFPASSGTIRDPYGIQVSADNPTVWYRMQDSSGSTSAADSAAATITGTGFSKTALMPASVNGVALGATSSPTTSGATSVGFDGRGADLIVPNGTPIQAISSGTTSQSYSAELWFNTAYLDGSTTSWQALLTKGDGLTNSTRGYGVYLRGDGDICVDTARGATLACTALATITIVPGRWYQLVTEFNGSQVAIFVNGIQVYSWTTATAGVMDVSSPLYIGSSGPTQVYNFRGAMAEFAFYNNINLSAARVQEHYNASQQAANMPISAVGGNNQVTLTWSAPATTGGSPVVGYKIVRATDQTSQPGIEPIGVLVTPTTLTSNTGSTLTTYVDQSAVNGTIYYQALL